MDLIGRKPERSQSTCFGNIPTGDAGPARKLNLGSSTRQAGSSEWGVDLEAFYFSKQHRRWFFGLLIGLVVMLGAVNEISFGEGGIAAGFALPLAIPIGTAGAGPIGSRRRYRPA